MFPLFSSTLFSAIAHRRTQCPTAILRLNCAGETLAFMGLPSVTILPSGSLSQPSEFGLNRLGFRMSLHHNLHHNLNCKYQIKLLHAVPELIQSSPVGLVAGALTQVTNITGFILSIFNLRASDIRKPVEYLNGTGSSMDADADADVKQPASGRYSFGSIPV